LQNPLGILLVHRLMYVAARPKPDGSVGLAEEAKGEKGENKTTEDLHWENIPHGG
jgi:hypothetical protein